MIIGCAQPTPSPSRNAITASAYALTKNDCIIADCGLASYDGFCAMMAQKTAEAFVERIDAFLDFMKECGLEKKLLDKDSSLGVNEMAVVIDNSNPLYEKTIVMTGFRDKILEMDLKKVGAKLGSSVSKNTFCVLIKDLESDESGKVLDAKRLGIPVLTLAQFKAQYGI